MLNEHSRPTTAFLPGAHPATTRRMISAVLLGWLLVTLAGCSLAPPVPPAPAFDSAPVTGTLKRRLTLQPDDATQPAQTWIALIRLDESRLRAVLLTPYGQRLVTLIHDDRGSRYEASDVPPAALAEHLPMPAAWLASRLQWCLWPSEALQEAFVGSAWSLTIDGEARIIRHHGGTVARITPAETHAARAEEVWLDDRQGQYRLRISPLEEPTP